MVKKKKGGMKVEPAVLTKLRSALNDGRADLSVDAVRSALDEGLGVDAILTALKGALEEVGEKYHNGEYFLPELVLGGKAAQAALNVLSPRINSESTGEILGTVVIGTVRGDIHDLGKTIVFAMMTAAGFRVYDLGTDVSPSKFVEKAKEFDADIVASSALLSTTKNRMKDIEEALVSAGIRGKVKTMVGGAAVSPEYAQKIGADGYGRDAYEAVAVAKSLMGLGG